MILYTLKNVVIQRDCEKVRTLYVFFFFLLQAIVCLTLSIARGKPSQNSLFIIFLVLCLR